MLPSSKEHVLVVGGGPVGLTLALILARYELPVLLLEAREAPTPPDESRAITWMPRGLELLDWLALGRKFARRGMRRTAHEFWGVEGALLSLPFHAIDSPHPYTLQLPQHDTEVLLEEAVRATGLVEIRRGHRVTGVEQVATEAVALVEGPEGGYRVAAPWAVACDGFHSPTRAWLGIGKQWRDYGAHTVVADFEMSCDLPESVSRVVFDPERPYGLFCFAPGRWRFIYRVNEGEVPRAMAEQEVAAELLRARFSHACVERFLWASAFRLGQAQSERYRLGRWLLAGDAAHGMGPSAGAGMMVGVLGAWRLAWRLALAFRGESPGELLFDDYEREQRAGADEVQEANGMIFRNMALRHPVAANLREYALRGLARLPALTRRLSAREALVSQTLPAIGAADTPRSGPWRRIDRLGAWKVGRRVPTSVLEALHHRGRLVHLSHLVIPIAGESSEAAVELARQVGERSPVPVELLLTDPVSEAPWREPAAREPVVALVRPDQHVAGLYGDLPKG